MKYLKITFLANYRAAGDEHKHRSEWPPSPWRIYNAFVEAHYNSLRAGNNPARIALIELEVIMPVILAKDVYPRHNVIGRYVPSNILFSKQSNSPKKFPMKLVPKIFPFREVKEAWVGWDVSNDVWEEIKRLSCWINHVGAADSLCTIEPAVPDGNFFVWMPAEYGKIRLRSSYKGCLSELDRVFGTKVKAVPVLNGYNLSRETFINGDMLSNQNYFWQSFYILPISSDFPFKAIHCSLLAGNLRAKLGQIARENNFVNLAEEIAGVTSHEKKDHILYAALPFVRGSYADGSIKGMMGCLPKSLSAFQNDLEICLGKLCSFSSTLGGVDFSEVFINEPRDPRATLDTLNRNFWGGESYTWQTATPVQIGFNKGKKEKINEQVAEECRFLGLPPPKYVETSYLAWWQPHLKATDFIPRRNVKNNGLFTNLRITFYKKVRGPIVLGWGKNFGMGLFYPM